MAMQRKYRIISLLVSLILVVLIYYMVYGLGAHLLKPVPLRNNSLTVAIPPLSSESFSFVNKQVIKNNLLFQSIPIGGLSGLSYDHLSGSFLALSDDKGKQDPPRFYELKLYHSFVLKKYELRFTAQVFLNKDNKKFHPIDPEGITFLNKQGVFISSEGVQLPELKAPPALLVFNREGMWHSQWSLPSLFWPTELKHLGQWGVKENKGFESLALTPDQKQLWLATEATLHQDEQQNKDTQLIRLTVLDLPELNMHKQVVYEMDTVIYKGALKGTNGLTDFFLMERNQLLSVERAYLKNSSHGGKRKMDASSVRLFFADCSLATDVSSYNSLKNKPAIPCKKKQVLDLSSVLGNDVDNIEGISITQLPAQRVWLLILVSDNNFSDQQETQFLFFHIHSRP